MSNPYTPPGLRARAQQLRETLSQMQELKRLQRSSRPGEGFTGTVDTRARLSQAREQLRRQVRVAAGLPALDSTR